MKILLILTVILPCVTGLYGETEYMRVNTPHGTKFFPIDAIDSLTFGTLRPGDPLVDIRDGQQYTTVVVGTQIWMAENLNVGIYIPSTVTSSDHSDAADNDVIEKYAYGNDTSAFASQGGLYGWDEAMKYGTAGGDRGICPENWHIPTMDEFYTLAVHLEFEYGLLSYTALVTGGSSGFDALFSGYRHATGPYSAYDSQTWFWSSTMMDQEAFTFLVTGIAGSRNDSTIDAEHTELKNTGCCIRCIKD